jgi:hypothetical protein
LYPGNVCFLLGRPEGKFVSQTVRRNTRHRADQKEEYSTQIRSKGRTLNIDQIRRKNTQHKLRQKEEHSTQIT